MDPGPRRWIPHRTAMYTTPLHAALVFAGVFAIYHSSFPGAWLLDDWSSVIENESIRSIRDWRSLLSPPTEAGVAGRPLANLTFALNYAISGLNPWSYRALNLILIATTAGVLAAVTRRTLLLPVFGGRFAAHATVVGWLTAALWVTHPIQTIVVNYISQRTEALMALCYVLTLYAFLRAATSASRAWSAAAVLACAAGMASKETMATAPFLILLYDRTFLAGSFAGAWRQRAFLHTMLATTWALLAMLMAQSDVATRGIGIDRGVSALTYLYTQCHALTLYLERALWPDPLVFDYGWSFVLKVGDVIPQGVILAVIFGATVVGLWRRATVSFPAACFFIILAPTSTLVPIVHQPVAESRMYLPLAAVAIALVLTATSAIGRRAVVPLVAVVFALAITATIRNRDYTDPVTLWRDTVAKQPRNARAHNLLAAALLQQNSFPEALRHADEAVRLRPTYGDAELNAGAALAALGRFAEAVDHYRAALRSDSQSPAAHANLGNALIALGQKDEARSHLEQAVRLNPRLPQPHNDLGVLCLDGGKVSEAIPYFETALRLVPDMADAHYNLGNALIKARRLPEAVSTLQTAVRLKPRFGKAHNMLGVALLLSGQTEQAVAHFETALRINPQHEEAHRNLAAAQSTGGR